MPNTSESARATLAQSVERALASLVAEGAPLVAAVSGGADSVALADALSVHAARWPLVAVAFVDHGLRDVAAERESARAAAERAGVRFVERRVAVGAGNLQAAARRARYAALIAVAREVDGHALVATGHTLSDQAETVLARLLRGAGLPGLAGLAPLRGRVVRPLLGVARTTTRAAGLPFADDPSNATPRFQRNRLRTILERFGPEQPALEAALARLAGIARASTRLLDAVALAAPDVRVTGGDREAIDALLVHVGRAHGARGLERLALAAWAEALVAGGLDAVSLGEGLRGLAREGRPAIVSDDDPRRTVVAWRCGTYRASAMTLEMTETRDQRWPHPCEAAATTAAMPEGETCVPADAIAWPVKLRPSRAGEAGVFGGEVDFDSGASLGGWRLDDASGRTLVPPARAAGAVPGGAAGPRSSPQTHWIRIVLKPL